MQDPTLRSDLDTGRVEVKNSGIYDGWTGGLNAYAMQPVAPQVTLAGGAAFTYGSGNYMAEYFGVTPRDSLASGLPVYVPGAARGGGAAAISAGLSFRVVAS